MGGTTNPVHRQVVQSPGQSRIWSISGAMLDLAYELLRTP
jgi:hypothetical protein